MPLSMGRVNDELVINDINASEQIKNRLLSLGFTKGTTVKIMQDSKDGTILLKVRDSKIALNKSLAFTIQVA